MSDLPGNVVPFKQPKRPRGRPPKHTPTGKGPQGPIRFIGDGFDDERARNMPEHLIFTGAKIRPTPANVTAVLEHDPVWQGVLYFDELRSAVCVTRVPPRRSASRAFPHGYEGPWLEQMTTAAIVWFELVYGMSPTVEIFTDAFKYVADEDRRHAVRDYLSALVWDGVPRASSLLAAYLGATAETGDAYVRRVSEIFLLSAVARAFKPGCKVDTVLVLEGGQGAFKSTALKVLAGERFFTDSDIPFGNKDACQMLVGKWIAELAEVDKHRDRDSGAMKSFISIGADNYRPSYGRVAKDHPRGFVFVATTNRNDYLVDDTGNRRWLPVQIGTIDVEALRRDRDQLWAEAVHRFHTGESWWPDSEAFRAAAKEETDDRLPEDARTSAIQDWLQLPSIQALAREGKGFPLAKVLLEALGIAADRQSRTVQTVAGTILKKLGIPKRKVSTPLGQQYHYFPPIISREVANPRPK